MYTHCVWMLHLFFAYSACLLIHLIYTSHLMSCCSENLNVASQTTTLLLPPSINPTLEVLCWGRCPSAYKHCLFVLVSVPRLFSASASHIGALRGRYAPPEVPPDFKAVHHFSGPPPTADEPAVKNLRSGRPERAPPPPPPAQPPSDAESRKTIETLAAFVARNGAQFEELARQVCRSRQIGSIDGCR